MRWTRLRCSPPEASTSIRVTPNHPFFVDGRGWVQASELGPATDGLATASGDRVDIGAARSLSEGATVYNLEVAHFHTYFVGHVHAWVHNQTTACCPEGGKPNSGYTASGIEYNAFPSRANIDYAMQTYLTDRSAARAQEPVSLGDFFGSSHLWPRGKGPGMIAESVNKDNLMIELLNPRPGATADAPIPFLRTKFAGSDLYLNDRYKDVQLFNLFDSTGQPFNPFPDAVYVPDKGAALVRVWNQYRQLSKGIPDGLSESRIRKELARMTTAAYVAGNIDGPFYNLGNAGFCCSQIKGQDGKPAWRGVVIDNGAPRGMRRRPWHNRGIPNLLGRGPVKKIGLASPSSSRLCKGSCFCICRRSGATVQVRIAR